MYFFIYENYLEVNANRKSGDMLFDFSLPDVFLEITYTTNYSHTVIES